MTCPFQYYVYKASQKSYRDLPCRYGETSTLFRNEDSGEMHGLTRVRQFTITEGHLIVRLDQMVEEFKGCLALAKYCLETLGVESDVTYHLAKWDPDNKEKYIGEPEVWEETQQHIREILTQLHIQFTEEVGEAAFYGPKVDINAKMYMAKEDTMITIQWMHCLLNSLICIILMRMVRKSVHILSTERRWVVMSEPFAWLIEKYAGLFPTWLCPEQVRVLPISEKYADYAQKVNEQIIAKGIRSSVDNRAEKIGFKICDARLKRVPYMLVVGEKEKEAGLVSVRSRYEGDEGQKSLETFIQDICKEIQTKEIREIKSTRLKTIFTPCEATSQPDRLRNACLFGWRLSRGSNT